MIAVGFRVADTLHHGELALGEEPRETVHARVERELVADAMRLGGDLPQRRAAAVIQIIGERHDGVQPVVAARKLQHNQNGFARPRR